MRIRPRPLRRFGALALLLLFAGGSLPGHLHAAGEEPDSAPGSVPGTAPGSAPAPSPAHEHEHGHDPAGPHPPADHTGIEHPEHEPPDHGHSEPGHSGHGHSDHDHSDDDACPGCLCPAGTAGCLALSPPPASRAVQHGDAGAPFALPAADAPPAGALLLGIFRPPRR